MFLASAFSKRCARWGCGIALIGTIFLSACAGKSLREQLEERREGDGSRNSGPALDHFYMDNPFQKERPPTYKEFFYKRCELTRRTPVPSEAEWACSDPIR